MKENNEVKITLTIPGISDLVAAIKEASGVIHDAFSSDSAVIAGDKKDFEEFATATPAVAPDPVPAAPAVPPVPPTIPTAPVTPAPVTPVAPIPTAPIPTAPIPTAPVVPPVSPTVPAAPTVPTAPVPNVAPMTPYPQTPTVPTAPAPSVPVAPPQYAAPTVPPVPGNIPPVGDSFPQTPVTVGSGAPGAAPFATAPFNVGAAPVYTVEMLSNAGARLIENHKGDQLVQLLNEYGAATLHDIKPEHYAAIADRLRALGAVI